MGFRAVSAAVSRAAADWARDTKRFSLAAFFYERCLVAHPQNSSVWVQAGNCHKDGRRFEKAQRCYDAAAQLAPSDPEAYLQIGHLKKLQVDVGGALDAFRRAADLGSAAAKVELSLVRDRIISAAAAHSLRKLPVFKTDYPESDVLPRNILILGQCSILGLAGNFPQGVAVTQALWNACCTPKCRVSC